MLQIPAAAALPLQQLPWPARQIMRLNRVSSRDAILTMLLPWFAILLTVGWAFRSEQLPAGQEALTGAGLLLALPFAVKWSIALGIVALLAQYAPRAGHPWTRWIAVASAVGGVLVVVEFALEALLRELAGLPAHQPSVRLMVLNGVLYASLLAAALVLEFGQRFRRTEVAESRLREELAQAGVDKARTELRLLQLEMNPHFLFNSLNSIAVLMHQDPPGAERMLVHLSDLLRKALDTSDTPQVPLAEELEYLLPFTEIERARFGADLTFTWTIDEAVEEAFVPRLILQPLVENAVKHGVAPRGRGAVEISAKRSGDRLSLRVSDDGTGPMDPAPSRRTGHRGLANVRRRLEFLYGDGTSLDLRPRTAGGTECVVTLPLVWEPVSAAEAGA